MSDNINMLQELTQKMTDPSQIRDDFNGAAALVIEMFREKYINRLNDAVSFHISKAKEEPPDSAKLLYALKPFINGDRHEQLDNTANLLIMLDALKNITGNRAIERTAPMTASLGIENASSEGVIHIDGIYEVDKTCLSRKKAGPIPGNLLAGIMLLTQFRNT